MNLIESKPIGIQSQWAFFKPKTGLIFFLCFPILILFSSNWSHAQPSKALQKHIERIVQPYLEEPNTFHLQVGILERNHTYQYLFTGGGTPITPKDSTALFGIGSVTKLFTASLLAAMNAKGIVNINDCIIKYLPDSLALENPHLQKITLKHLASHSSGLPKMPKKLTPQMGNKQDIYANYSLEEVYQFLRDFRPPMDKRHRRAIKKGKKIFLYSHLGMGLLGHLLEVAGEKPYSELLEEYLFHPLDIRSMYLPDSILENANRLEGHDFAGNIEAPKRYASLYGAEGGYISLEGMLQLLKVTMDTSYTTQNTFLKSCLTIQNETDRIDVSMGLGWFIIHRGSPRRNPSVYTHSGKIGGFSTYVAFIEATQTAVVVLANSTRRVDNIGIQILELINR